MLRADGKVNLWDTNGQHFARWPLDARLMLERGGYTTDQPLSTDSVSESVPLELPATAPHLSHLKAGDIGPTGAPVVIGAAVPGDAKTAGSVLAPKPQGRRR